LIFGSYAHQQRTAASDVDLLVVGAIRQGELRALLTSTEKAMDRAINTTLYTAEEMTRKLRARDDFLVEVLSRSIIPIKGLGKPGRNEATRMTLSRMLRILNRKKP
jgi:predicted nucleotidyltransferase